MNPSARMAVHHFRFQQLLHTREGILNETPRHRGGCTLRLLRFTGFGSLNISELPSQIRWMPWWYPASNPWAKALVLSVYSRALSDDRPSKREREVFSRIIDEFHTTSCGDLTIGESLYAVMEALHREYVPELPILHLISFTKSPLRHLIADALADMPGGLLSFLSRWTNLEHKRSLEMLAVGIDAQNQPFHVRFDAGLLRLEMRPLQCDDTVVHASQYYGSTHISPDLLFNYMKQGRVVPGSRLVCAANVCLHGRSVHVRHFGNTYGRLGAAGYLLNVSNAEEIAFCRDDEDSWHFADFYVQPERSSERYPLHLLDMTSTSPSVQDVIPYLVYRSLKVKCPISLIPKENLNATLRAGRT